MTEGVCPAGENTSKSPFPLQLTAHDQRNNSPIWSTLDVYRTHSGSQFVIFPTFVTPSFPHFLSPSLPPSFYPLALLLFFPPSPFLSCFFPAPSLLSHLFFPSSLPKFLLKNGLKSGAPLPSKAGLISLDFKSSDCLKLEPDTVPVCAQCQQCFGSAESLHIDVFYKSISFSPLHVGKEFKRERTRSWCFLRNPTHLLPLQQQHPPSCP